MLVPRYWRIGLGAALALSVTAAFAADQVSPYPECSNRKPSAQDIEGAKGAHKAASQFYDRGDYDKAIRYWNDAYGFDCTANDLLINVANAQEKKGDRAAAVATLEVYLQRAGSNATIEQKVKNLKVLLAPTASATASAAPTAPPTAPPTASAAPTTPPTAAPDGPRPFGSTPWIVVGGGSALVVVGAILLGVGAKTYSDADKACPKHDATCPPDVAANGNKGLAEKQAGTALLSVGLGAAAGGLVWQLFANKPQAQGAPAKGGLKVLPAIGPRQGGITLGGAF
jgi:tetratricopeptide (TPR) repeat protein